MWLRGTTLLAAAAVCAFADESVVVTQNGPIQGVVFDDFRAFVGVPYAEPPVGPRRWQPSVFKQPWSGTWDATQDPPGCMQLCVNDEPPHICPQVISEDCLYLNVWTPRLANLTEPVPVLVFIHGGNFWDGAAGGLNKTGPLLYDGEQYVKNTNQIVVVIQYRLGALGFLYLGGKSSVTSNYGLMDQITALQWVKNNIAAFGGDPTRVTAIGQSAGAMSLSLHMTRPQNEALFNGVVMMSNPFGEPYRDTSNAQLLGSLFANFSGCPVQNGDYAAAETCLRAQSANTLLSAQEDVDLDLIADLDHILQVVVVWSPVVGTDYLTRAPIDAWQGGWVIDVPYMIGTTSEEAVIFVYEALDFPLSQTLYEIAISVLVGPDAYQESLALYPLPDPVPDDLRVFAATLLTDALFLCATRNASEALQAAQPYRKSKAYHWLYSHQMSWSSSMWGANFTECDDHVCHGSDLPAMWHPNVLPVPGFANYTAEENQLSATMEWYVANFAANGAPGVGDPLNPTVQWPAYDANTRQTVQYEVASAGGIQVLNAYRSKFCDWYDNVIGYHLY